MSKRNAPAEEGSSKHSSSSKRQRRLPPTDDEDDAPSATRIDLKGKGIEKAADSGRGLRYSKRKLRKRTKDVVSVSASDVPSASASVAASPAADSDPTVVSSDHEEGPDTKASSSTTVMTPPADAAAEIARLRKELKSKDDLLRKHQESFASLQGTLSCQICMEVMMNPYITSCGHTSCLGCLQSWFKAPPPDNPNQDEPLAPHLRKKTCPTCRSPIHHRPTSVFLVKGVISTLKPYLDLPEDTDPASRPVPIVPGGEAAADPWRGVFPPANNRPDRYAADGVDGVIGDEEDGVFRCADCLYEIFDGICQGCGRVFDDLLHDGGFTDDEEDEDGPDWPPYHHDHAYHDHGHNPYPYHHHGAPPFDYDEDEEDDGEMDDFIDDDPHLHDHQHHYNQHWPFNALRDRHLPPPLDYHPPEEYEDEEESEDDDPYPPAPPRAAAAPRHHRRAIIISDDEDEEESDIESEHGGGDPEINEITERRFREIQARNRERDMYGDGIQYPQREAIPGHGRDDDDESESEVEIDNAPPARRAEPENWEAVYDYQEDDEAPSDHDYEGYHDEHDEEPEYDDEDGYGYDPGYDY